MSARHAVAANNRVGYSLTPYGTWHARQIGSSETACGQPALTWRYFWTLDFGRAGSNTCIDCLVALDAARH